MSDGGDPRLRSGRDHGTNPPAARRCALATVDDRRPTPANCGDAQRGSPDGRAIPRDVPRPPAESPVPRHCDGVSRWPGAEIEALRGSLTREFSEEARHRHDEVLSLDGFG